ncbi:MAG: hypothetical protein P1P63_04865 [Treponemataceae bacterium]
MVTIIIALLLAVLVGVLSLLVLIQKAQIDELTEQRNKLSGINEKELVEMLNEQMEDALL